MRRRLSNPTKSGGTLSEHRNSLILAVTLALVSVFVLGGLSFAFFPSRVDSATLSERVSSLAALGLSSSVRSLPSPAAIIWVRFPVDAVCIEGDGGLNSTSVPITRVGDTYVFMGDVVNLTIVVQRDNIVIDGGGHRLLGFKNGESYAYAGMVLDGRHNVTVKNIVLSQFTSPLRLQNSNDITITNNTFLDDGEGVVAESVSNSSIINNDFRVECDSIYFGSAEGAPLSTSNIISRNNISGGSFGISTYSGSSNTITLNNIVNVGEAITAGQNTTVANNSLIHGIDGITLVSECNVYGNTVLNFSQSGLSIQGANSTICENVVANCSHSLLLDSYDARPLGNNTLYHNSFLNNTENLLLQGNASEAVNFWDYGKEGNYWSNHAGADGNGDGVGDVPFDLGFGNVDRYPLVQPYVAQVRNDGDLEAALFGAGGIVAAIGISALTFSIITQRIKPKVRVNALNIGDLE